MNHLIIFDLDGTLIDTFPDLFGALHATLEHYALPSLAPNDALRRSAGKGTAHLFDTALTLTKTQIDEPEKEKLVAFFLVFYAQNIAVKSRLFPHAAEAVDHLKNEGWRFAVCTNKNTALTQKLLEALGITALFDAVSCGDTFPFKKPDKRHVLATIAQTSCEKAIMIGDTQADVDAARSAGIPVIGATFGYASTPMRELRPTALLDDYADLPKTIASLARQL